MTNEARLTLLMPQEKHVFDLDVCDRTVDADVSDRSLNSTTRQPAIVVGDPWIMKTCIVCGYLIKDMPANVNPTAIPTSPNVNCGPYSCLAGRHLKGCLKVQTQLESISRISSPPTARYSSAPSTDAATHDVRFDTVEFRHYHPVLGDNPSTSSGAPIGIGWSYNPKDTIMVDLEEYERAYEGLRRTKKELAIPSHVREAMLREAGYSRRDIKLAVDINRRVKAKRISSVQQQKIDPIRKWVETMKHGVRRLIL